MNEKHIYIFKENNKRPIVGLSPNYEYSETYKSLDIDEDLKQNLKQQIESEEDFEISIEDMKVLKQAFFKQIEQLIKHPDFNPFKEKLREKYPKQYGNELFKFKRVTYYLYNKGKTFYIDHKIRNFDKRIKLIDYFLEKKETLKYTFR